MSSPALAPAGDTRRRVLVVEDDADIAEAITYHLERASMSVRVARTGEEGLHEIQRGADLVLLDLNLPGVDGMEVCRMIRRQATTAHLPVIIVSARADEIDRVLGLEMGADDYVVKPFSAKELVARCRVALRRSDPAASTAPRAYRDENFDIDFEACLVRFRGTEIRLTPKEFELFRTLVERPGRTMSRERLLARVWGESEVDARTVDAHVRRLRLKLGAAREHVQTLVGFGYRFVVCPGDPRADD